MTNRAADYAQFLISTAATVEDGVARRDFTALTSALKGDDSLVRAYALARLRNWDVDNGLITAVVQAGPTASHDETLRATEAAAAMPSEFVQPLPAPGAAALLAAVLMHEIQFGPDATDVDTLFKFQTLIMIADAQRASNVLLWNHYAPIAALSLPEIERRLPYQEANEVSQAVENLAWYVANLGFIYFHPVARSFGFDAEASDHGVASALYRQSNPWEADEGPNQPIPSGGPIQ